MNFQCKFRQCPSIRRHRFPVKSAKFQRFGDVFRWFLHFICRMSAIFLLPVCWTSWPGKYTTRVDPRQSVFELWVITFPIGYHWKCVRGHCACADESRDPWVGCQKQLHFWNPRLRFVYSLYNFYWATTTIKGRLLSSRPMLKPFSGEKILSRRNGAQKWRFWGKIGVQILDISFATPKRHILRQNRCARLGCI